jgi:hypothetical protein
MKRIKLFIAALLFSAISFAQGIILKSTSEILEVVTTTTADIDYKIVWFDVTSSGAGLATSTVGKITTATTTTVTAAPAGSTTRHIKEVFINNIHASTANAVMFKLDISATEYQLSGSVTLQAITRAGLNIQQVVYLWPHLSAFR